MMKEKVPKEKDRNKEYQKHLKYAPKAHSQAPIFINHGDINININISEGQGKELSNLLY
jgi:hypothetical protein